MHACAALSCGVGGCVCAHVRCALLGRGGRRQPRGSVVSAWLSTAGAPGGVGQSLCPPPRVSPPWWRRAGSGSRWGWAPFREERAGSTAHSCARLSASPLSPVIYNGCPRAFEAGIWWPQTKFGQPAAVPCPKGSVGKYHGVWPVASIPDRTVNGVGLAGGLAKASELTGCSVLKEFLYPKCQSNKNFFVHRKRQNLERAQENVKSTAAGGWGLLVRWG